MYKQPKYQRECPDIQEVAILIILLMTLRKDSELDDRGHFLFKKGLNEGNN